METVETGRACRQRSRGHPGQPATGSPDPIGIGKGLKTKINANIGTSADYPHLEDELKKLDMVEALRADAVMDLSTGGNVNRIRRALRALPHPFRQRPPFIRWRSSPWPRERRSSTWMIGDMLEYIQLQAEDGVDFMTIHAGLTRRAIEKLRKMPRRAGDRFSRRLAVNRLDDSWRGRRIPFFEHFDRVLKSPEI